MLRIYDKSKSNIYPFTKYKNLCITKKLELDDKTLTFEAPYSEIYGIVELEGYVETRDDIFVIKEIEASSDGNLAKVYAQLDLEDLEGKAFVDFTSTTKTIRETLALAFSGTGWTVGTSTITKKRTISLMGSSLDILKQCLSTYRAEIRVFSKAKRIDIYEKVGSNKGVYFTSALNLKKLEVKSNSHDFYTEIEPYGKDYIDIKEVNGGKSYLSDYTYSTKKKRYIWKDERYTIPENLKEDAEYKLSDLCKPYVSYSADVIDFASISDKYKILDYETGDTIILIDDATRTREEQRIQELTEYPDNPENNTVTIANTKLTFDEYVSKYNEAAQTVENITTDNFTVSGSSIDSVDASKVDKLEETVVATGSFQQLKAEVLNVSGELTAVSADIGTLRANVGSFEELTAQTFDAVNANIVDLQTNSLTAGSAVITGLEANYANIKTLLSGNAGVGDLQTIVLNASNASINTGFFRQLVASNITVNDLLAGRISTDKFTIGSDDGGLLFEGNLAQWTDENDNVRIQIGKDASGNYSFAIADENGTPLFYENGITADGIPDKVIVNSMVADNANVSAHKLNVASIFEVINDNTQYTLSSSVINMDTTGQSLDVAFTKMTQDVEASVSAAQDATDAANRALEALSGISTLDALGISLSNDAHVVHTDYDGGGGVWTDCSSTVSVYLGDTNITEQVSITVTKSEGLTGSYNNTTKTYTVSGMSVDNGWVDFHALYGGEESGIVLTKRFSVSKARDGRIGHSYQLKADVPVIKRSLINNTLTPSTVTFSAVYNAGGGNILFAGIFKIEESIDDVHFTQTYLSATRENSVQYTPENTTARSIKCTLYDETGTMEFDYMSVLILVDPDMMATEMASIKTQVTNYKLAQDEMRVEFAEMESDYYGTKNGNLILQTPYTIQGDNVTFNAVIYKAGINVTTDYPATAFTWLTRTEHGDNSLGTGYTKTAKKSEMGFGGVMICRFETDLEEA